MSPRALPLLALLALLAGCFPFYSSRPLPVSHRDRCRQNLAQGWCDASCGRRQPEICCTPKNVRPWALGLCVWEGCDGATVFGACPATSGGVAGSEKPLLDAVEVDATDVALLSPGVERPNSVHRNAPSRGGVDTVLGTAPAREGDQHFGGSDHPAVPLRSTAGPADRLLKGREPVDGDAVADRPLIGPPVYSAHLSHQIRERPRLGAGAVEQDGAGPAVPQHLELGDLGRRRLAVSASAHGDAHGAQFIIGEGAPCS